MAESLKTKSVCVCDSGLFVELALTLSKSFGKAYYFCPWTSQLPNSNRLLIGQGLPGIERVENLFDILDDVDLFVFPDLYFGDLQEHLVKLGKRVWGSRGGEELELDRVAAKKLMQRAGINIGPYTVLKGLANLREYLKENRDVYVKISKTRGDCETFHSESYRLIEPRLDELENHLGAKKLIMPFVVEEAIGKSVSNLGWDCYTVDGQFPYTSLCGLEVKDRSYVGLVKEGDGVPEQLTDINRRMSPTLKEAQYRNFFTVEVSVTKNGKAFAVDPTARFSSPPGELVQLLYSNLAEILWQGADGKLIEPEMSGKFGAQLILYSEWADSNWQSLDVPKKIREQVKFRNLTVIKDRLYVVPQAVGLSEIGGAVAVGDTLEEAIEGAKEVAEQVRGYYVKSFPECLDHAQEEIDKLAEYGVKL